jgi:hypothetical protein
MNPNDHLSELELAQLPDEAAKLCEQLNAPPRLIAHLILVHDVAVRLLNSFSNIWPDLVIDREEVLFGASTHDIGKAVHKNELTEPGSRHEAEGWRILRQANISSKLARFTQTHAKWNNDKSITLEDLVVALADSCWKNRRSYDLEMLLAKKISKITGMEELSIFAGLDLLIESIALDADKRLAWQEQFAIEI